MTKPTKIYLKGVDCADLAEIRNNYAGYKATFPPDTIKWKNENSNTYSTYNEFEKDYFIKYESGYDWSKEAANGGKTFSNAFNNLTASAKGYRPFQELKNIYNLSELSNSCTLSEKDGHITFNGDTNTTYYTKCPLIVIQGEGGRGAKAIMQEAGGGGGGGGSICFYYRCDRSESKSLKVICSSGTVTVNTYDNKFKLIAKKGSNGGGGDNTGREVGYGGLAEIRDSNNNLISNYSVLQKYGIYIKSVTKGGDGGIGAFGFPNYESSEPGKWVTILFDDFYFEGQSGSILTNNGGGDPGGGGSGGGSALGKGGDGGRWSSNPSGYGAGGGGACRDNASNPTSGGSAALAIYY